jgi:hypothetical protein
MNKDFAYTNDRVIVNGDWATVEDGDAAAQRIKDRLETFIKEWFLDLSYGVPYRETILVKGARIDVINAVLKGEILKSQDGTFTEFDIELDSRTRKLTVSYKLNTTLGDVSGTVTI